MRKTIYDTWKEINLKCTTVNVVSLRRQCTGESSSVILEIIKKHLIAPLKKTSETHNALLTFIVIKTFELDRKNPAPFRFC